MRPPLPLARRARAALLGAALALAPAGLSAQPPTQPPASPPAATPEGAPSVQPAQAGPPDTARRAPAESARVAPARPSVPRADAAPAAAPAAGAAPVPAATAAHQAARVQAARVRNALLAEPALPVHAGSGPSAILHTQVLLDAAGFSPGMLDGQWGDNMHVALFSFRDAAGLDPEVDQVDEVAYRRLRRLAQQRPVVTTYVLDAADVRGPYRPLPRGVAAKARAECLCYESLLERLSERFHVRPALLRALNPGVNFGAARAGTALMVPNTWRLAPRARVARVVVDKAARGVRGLDAAGGTVFWLPATVGSRAMPSPEGALRVSSVTRNPHYRWDPAVLRDVSRREPVRMLPPGPNNMVGNVWVALSRPHVGIHGTPDPETVGYVASHGCVRLTNWDALWFSRLARPGLPVVFE